MSESLVYKTGDYILGMLINRVSVALVSEEHAIAVLEGLGESQGVLGQSLLAEQLLLSFVPLYLLLCYLLGVTHLLLYG